MSMSSDAEGYAAVFQQAVSLVKGWVQGHGDKSKIMVQRSVRDIDGNKPRSFVHTYDLTHEGKWQQAGPFPFELNGVVVYSPSPSGKRLAVVRESAADATDGAASGGKAKSTTDYVIEVWGDGAGGEGLVARVPSAGVHGKIVADAWFGGFAWSPDETRAVYVAQTKAEETRSFFSKEPDASSKGVGSAAAPSPGGQFAFKEDWGEKYTGVTSVGLFAVDMSGGSVCRVEGVPEGLSPGQPCFSKDGRHVVYTAWSCEPRMLGIIYCYQRPCKLYSVPTKDWFKGTPGKDASGGGGISSTDKAASASSPPVHKCLCPSSRLARSGRFSPSGDTLAWLSREEGFDTHNGGFRLKTAPWDAETGTLAGGNEAEHRTLVDIVETPAPRSGPGSGPGGGSAGLGFPGLWAHDLPVECWAPDGGSLFLSSDWGSRASVVRVDAKSGEVTRVVAAGAAALDSGHDNDGDCCLDGCSASVLAVCDRGVLVSASAPNAPGGIAVVEGVFTSAKAAAAGGGARALVGPRLGKACVSASVQVTGDRAAEVERLIGRTTWRIMDVLPTPNGATTSGQPNDEQQPPPFEAILMLPPQQAEVDASSASSVAGGATPNSGGRSPLLVMPHGGPHGVMPTLFIPALSFMCAVQGFALLLVNYRGSTGFGTTALDSLPGKAGEQDVEDVVKATKEALASEPGRLDPGRVGVVGGSHGGFLATHLSGQHPEMFKAVAARNPVTNIATMVTASDIPDWCYIEALGTGSYDFDTFRAPTAEELDKMWKVSPVAHMGTVRAPTLVALGDKDRRVPSSQGKEWYQALKSKGVETKLLVYPEDVHAIDKPASEADQWINIAKWMKRHL